MKTQETVPQLSSAAGQIAALPCQKCGRVTPIALAKLADCGFTPNCPGQMAKCGIVESTQLNRAAYRLTRPQRLR